MAEKDDELISMSIHKYAVTKPYYTAIKLWETMQYTAMCITNYPPSLLLSPSPSLASNFSMLHIHNTHECSCYTLVHGKMKCNLWLTSAVLMLISGQE